MSSAVIWRYVRVFAAAFVATFSVDQFVSANEDVRMTLLKSAVAAAIAAVFKAWRESDSMGNSMAQKMPL